MMTKKSGSQIVVAYKKFGVFGTCSRVANQLEDA